MFRCYISFSFHFFISLAFFTCRFGTQGLDVNQILDILDEEHLLDVDEIYLNPPFGDESDGYDESDSEAGDPVKISRTILQVNKGTTA